MLRTMKFLALLMLLVGSCFAGVICTETSSGPTAGDSANGYANGGCIQSLPVGGTTIIVASDAELSFDPFGFGADTSDGIRLDAGWLAQSDIIGWVQLPSSNTWVLPADLSGIGCGVENSTTCEPVGKWYFPGAVWTSSDIFDILEPDGTLSDRIIIDNNGPDNFAQVLFQSDAEIPEPGSAFLVLAGLAVVAAGFRRRAWR